MNEATMNSINDLRNMIVQLREQLTDLNLLDLKKDKDKIMNHILIKDLQIKDINEDILKLVNLYTNTLCLYKEASISLAEQDKEMDRFQQSAHFLKTTIDEKSELISHKNKEIQSLKNEIESLKKENEVLKNTPQPQTITNVNNDAVQTVSSNTTSEPITQNVMENTSSLVQMLEDVKKEAEKEPQVVYYNSSSGSSSSGITLEDVAIGVGAVAAVAATAYCGYKVYQHFFGDD